MCAVCLQQWHSCNRELASGFFDDSPRSSSTYRGVAADTGGTDVGVQAPDQDVYNRLSVAWFVGGPPYVIKKKMRVRVVPVQIRKFDVSSFADFERLATAENAWRHFSAGVIAINLDYSSSLIFKFGKDPIITTANTALSFLRDNARSSIGLLVRGEELAIVTVYWYAGQKDTTRDRVCALRAATA